MKSNRKYRNFLPLLHWNLLPVVILLICLTSCKKDWLNEKPNSQLSVLSNLSDLQELNDNLQNTYGNYLCEVGSDDNYLPAENTPYLDADDLADYIWAPNGYPTNGEDNWTALYQSIFACNTVIAALSNVTVNASNLAQYNQVYGTALFYRATDYYNLSQAYIKPYDPSTANTDPGIPLRLQPDIAQKVGRGTVQQVYTQIIADFLKAKNLLPSTVQAYKTRPIKQGVYASLARMYLSMSDYNNALAYADSSLSINNDLLDYNLVVPQKSSLSMPPFGSNPEVITYGSVGTDLTSKYLVTVDSILYESYASNDLRKSLFFNVSEAYDGPYRFFRGGYSGISGAASIYTGIANDELYLIRAECNARLNNVTAAMNDLNTLLVKRYESGTFTNLTASTATDALNQILMERRKELFMRATRWSDLRRLNKDPNYAKSIIRILNGQTYTLAPSSNLYVWPIPENEIQYSGIAQNPR
jgi:tetratricopeptide (TPR) repeat protein